MIIPRIIYANSRKIKSKQKQLRQHKNFTQQNKKNIKPNKTQIKKQCKDNTKNSGLHSHPQWQNLDNSFWLSLYSK